MVYVYVLISAQSSYERKIAENLSMLDEVIDVEPLIVEETALADPFFEEYELIAKIKARNFNDLKKIIDNKINNIEGIEKIKVAIKPKL